MLLKYHSHSSLMDNYLHTSLATGTCLLNCSYILCNFKQNYHHKIHMTNDTLYRIFQLSLDKNLTRKLYDTSDRWSICTDFKGTLCRREEVQLLTQSSYPCMYPHISSLLDLAMGRLGLGILYHMIRCLERLKFYLSGNLCNLLLFQSTSCNKLLNCCNHSKHLRFGMFPLGIYCNTKVCKKLEDFLP